MSWLMRTDRRKPDPPPVRTEDRVPVLIGTGVWMVALVVVLIVTAGRDAGWTPWACAAGLALGVVGIVYTTVKRHP